MHRKISELKKHFHRLAIAGIFLPVVSLPVVSILVACEQPAKDDNYSILTFGTLVDVTIYDTDENRADAAFEQLQKDFDGFHQHWSPWTDATSMPPCCRLKPICVT